jgi:hypothetical protein
VGARKREKDKSLGGTRNEKIQSFDVVFVVTKFEKADLETRVVFEGKDRVSGLFFLPKTK